MVDFPSRGRRCGIRVWRGCNVILGLDGSGRGCIRVVESCSRCRIMVRSGWCVLNVGDGLKEWGNCTAYECDAWRATYGFCRRRVQVIMRRGRALMGRVCVRLEAR